MAALLERNVAVGHALRKERHGGRLRAIENAVDHGLTVEGVGQRLAHAHVLRDRALRVDENGAGGDRLAHRRVEALLVRELLERVARELVAVGAEDEVDLALFKRHQHGLRVGHDVPANGGYDRLITPVALVAAEERVLLVLMFGEHPGTRACETGHAVLRPAVLHAGGRDEAERAREPELDECGEVRMPEMQAPGVLVDHFARLDLVDHVEPGVARAVGHDGIDVLLDGVGRKRRAVRELDAAAQMEGVGAAVPGDLPALGKRGLNPFGRIEDERLEDHGLSGHLAQIKMRIDVADVLHARIFEHGLLPGFPGRVGFSAALKHECAGDGKSKRSLHVMLSFRKE